MQKQRPLPLVERSSEIEKQKRLSPIEQSSKIEKRKEKPLTSAERSSEIGNLIVHLTAILDNWDEGPNVSIT